MGIQRTESSGVSRRDFIKGASISAAALAGLSLSACGTSSSSSTDAAGSTSTASSGQGSVSDVWALDPVGDPTETLDYELCVIGGGGTGLAAGIQAMQLGVNVIVLEQNSTTGGAFIGSEGLFAVGSHWQKEAGATFNTNEIIEACLDFHHWIPSAALYQNFFGHTAGSVDWLESLGVEFDHVQSLGDSWVTWHVYKGIGSEGTGVTFMKSFGEAAEKIGLPIELECVAKKIVMENGKVAGVIAERSDGTVIKVNCQAVIVGTGGYASNGDLIHALNGAPADRVYDSGSFAHRVGQGLKMMVDAGATMADGSGCIAWYGPIAPDMTYGSPLQATTCMQPTLWVDQNAKRFVREDMFLKNFAFAGNAVAKRERVFTIVNRATLQRYQDEGSDVGVGVYVNAGTPLPGLLDDVDAYVAKANGRVFTADTIRELADACGLDPDALEETFEEHEQYVANGADLEFGKPAKYLFSMAEGPYYAFDVNDGIFCTCGGIKVTPDTEVLNDKDEVIEGLYAGGCDAGGFYGDTYDVGIAGGSCASWAINSGRLAAKHAAVLLGYTVDDM